MRKAILMMLLAGVSSGAVAEWVVVSTPSPGVVIYADSVTVRNVGDMVRIWILTDYKTAPDTSLPYLSAKGQAEFNCKEERMRSIYATLHSENMGKGKILRTFDEPNNWSPIAPDARTLWKFACRKP